MALHLERKIGQEITIGENIVITLRSIDRERDRATISIEAPQSMLIMRGEIDPRKMFL